MVEPELAEKSLAMWEMVPVVVETAGAAVVASVVVLAAAAAAVGPGNQTAMVASNKVEASLPVDYLKQKVNSYILHLI